MPNINDFVGKKDTKKGSSWSLPTISMQASTPQRRPGRGDDALPQSEQDAEIASSSAKKVEPKLSQSEAKVEPNLSQTRAKVEPELEPQLRPRGPSSSSSSSVLGLKNLKTTTTGAGVSDNIDPLPGDWDQIDSTPLADLGFSRAHLIQLARDGKLSVEEVQDSIHFFAFDLKRNGKGKEIKGPPVSFFMGILRKGVPYAPPSNFESPEEAVRRLYVESKRRLKERRESQEQEIKELEFSEWRNELTREAINAIVPEVSRGFPKLSESALKAHFDEYVWPDRRSEVPCHTAAEQAEIRQQIEQSLQDGAIL